MKRLLAALLTLSMLVGIVPFNAFAESPGTNPETFAAAQESPGLDDETVQSIVSDSLLQGQYAPPQQTQPIVDTSNMSMEATDSFGKLLVNSIDSQNSASRSENRVIGVTVDGRTATVEYVAAEDADLVVGIYTDNSAEEMVASGTTSVLATVETSSSSFATVNISGTIPEYYTVKCYLLDKMEHAPLSEVYANESYTQAMVDLNTATVDDFPADRVINFDDDSSTNFAVVKSNIVFITPDTTSDAENTVTQKDNENLVYTITNATDAITNLHSGNILTLEDTQGSLLIVRVASITVNGDSVTIQGDDTLEITDVFDVLKIEESAESGELIHSDEDMDEAVTYLGVRENIDSENSFQIKDGGITDNIPLLDDSLHEFNVSGTVNDMKDGMLSATVKGKLLLKANIDFAYYISLNNQWLALSSDISVSGDLSVSGAITGKVPLGHLHTPDFLEDKFGVKAEITPNLVLELSAKFAFKYSYAQNIIWKYSTSNGFQNLSKSAEGKIEPVVKDGKDTTDTISIFAGLEVGPKIKLNDELLWLEFKLKGGITTTAERLASDDEMRHECAQCLDFTETVNGKFTITLIIFKTDYSKFGIPKEIKLLDIPIGNWYWSLTFGEFGEGTCPHIAYRVTISLDGSKESGITIYEKKSNGTHYEFTELGQTDETGVLKTYLASGSYDLTASIGKQNYSAVTTVYDAATEVELSPERSEQPSQPEDTPDYTIENGRLTINNEKVMLDYASASDTPWYNSRDEITYILTQYMVKKISSYAFADCNKVTTVQIGDDITEIGDYAFSGCTSLEKVVFAGTMAKWKEVQIGIGNEALGYVNIVCSDGTITGHFPELSDSDYVLNDGVLTIYTQNAVNDYVSANQTPWYNLRSSITKIIVKDRVHKIGSYSFWGFSSVKEIVFEGVPSSLADSAFENCFNLQSISYNGTINNWKKIDIQNDSDSPYTSQIFVATIYCTDDTILSQGYCGFEENNLRWILTESKKLIIWGSGKMAEYQTNYSPWWSKNYKTVTIDEGVTSIGRNAFYDTEIESITLPNSIESIEREAFSYAKNLSQLNFSTNLKKIDDYAFSHCDSLKEVNIPDGTVEIGAAFISCSSLERIHFPDSITKLGSMYGCTSLNELHLPCNVTYICNSAFSGCTNLRNITLPANLKEIGEYAFGGCTMLDNVTIPDSVETIYRGAFSNCKNLKTIHLPSSLKNISEYLFSSCSSLQKIILPKNINAINSYAFKECILLEEITIPTKCQNIGIQAFSGCKGLKNIKIPGSVTGIGINAFENCSGLIRIDFDQGLWSIGDHVFSGCNQLSKVSIPDSVKSIGADIFADCDLLSNLTYHGTTTQWNKIKIDTNNLKLSQVTIHCTDGDILPTSTVSSEENSIFLSTATGDDHSFAASFSDLTPGVSYAVIVSRSEIDPLAPENLIYINQFRASSSGYQQSFQTPRSSALNADDMTYVIASGIYSFDETPTPTPTPGGGSSSGGGGGGGGGGAAVLIGVGAAAAITAGVIMMSPVDVKGRVVLADQAAVPGAKISLLREGKVVAQTTADENGSFSLKAKRGSYELTAAYTTADGQLIYKTIDIKAPAKDLTVTF